uniref:Putative glycoside hydrolase family 61 n=1 Tax=uncultured eukaryote TaxID=100272 RepID=G8YZS7_9EUKA|nr:putative glycoside hydrolase family 61 [uncultured eukaryote]
MHLQIISALLLASEASAHGGVMSYSVGGTTYKGYGVKGLHADNRFTTTNPGATIQRHWAEIRPVTDPASPTLACNKPGSPGKLSATIQAGANITAFWNNKQIDNPWPHNSGPITVYMTECKGDCSTWAQASEGEWFKIYQAGLLSGTVGQGQWGTTKMISNGYSVTTRIPASLKPGNYLIRHETINLARAPAEFYPECAQLKVTGSGTTSPPKEYRFKLPGVYKKTDVAIKYSYRDSQVASSSKYIIPGPEVWKG